VLIIGSGAREHAILKALLRSERPLCLYAYPGNPGMETTDAPWWTHPSKTGPIWAGWAGRNDIDLVIVGPEVPLVEGIVDIFRKKRLTIFGPTKKAAQLEGSKCFAKKNHEKIRDPTASFRDFH